MAVKFHWTKRARRVFTMLTGGGNTLALRDLLAGLGIAGKSAQSSLVRSLGRWARAGLIAIDKSAPLNFPRYSLTKHGLKALKAEAKSIQTKAAEFVLEPRLVSQVDQNPVEGNVDEVIEPPVTKFKCPKCGLWAPKEQLKQELTEEGVVKCEGCGHLLTRFVRAFDDE